MLERGSTSLPTIIADLYCDRQAKPVTTRLEIVMTLLRLPVLQVVRSGKPNARPFKPPAITTISMVHLIRAHN